jgi:glycosyltransferase involved in cell wall biosynthesis
MSGQATQMTVCIPVYNAMPYLPDTLESIRNQSFADFKILIIDDGSKDESLAYLQSISDPRITLIHQQNAGLTATLNRMLEILGSGWLVRQDADDIALPDRMKRLQEYIERYPEAGMIYSQAAHYQQGALKGRLLTTPTDETGLRSFLATGYLPSICHPSIALRVEAARAIGGYRFDLHVEDYDLYWRIGLKYDVAMIPEVLLGYRMTGSSVSDQNNHKQATNILFIQYLLLSELWQRANLSYEQVVSVLERMVDRGHLNFRKYMRSAMVEYGQRKYLPFTLLITKAFLASPKSFMTRFFSRSQIAGIGASPKSFESQSSRLWPVS